MKKEIALLFERLLRLLLTFLYYYVDVCPGNFTNIKRVQWKPNSLVSRDRTGGNPSEAAATARASYMKSLLCVADAIQPPALNCNEMLPLLLHTAHRALVVGFIKRHTLSYASNLYCIHAFCLPSVAPSSVKQGLRILNYGCSSNER